MNKKRFVEKLMKLVTIQSESYNTTLMQRQILKIVQSIGGCIISRDKYGNIYVTKGESDTYPTMVCHIDTVHDIQKGKIIAGNIDGNIVAFNATTMEQVGTGGDDKVGIHITLELLKKHSVMKAVFFLDEEVGCIGSAAADFSFFDDSRYVLECDRRGYGDFVNEISGVQLTNKQFENDIKDILFNYDYSLSSGGMTDVQEISLNTKAVCANMSCGYYLPHTDQEYINIQDVILTFEMCDDIFTRVKKQYTVEGVRKKSWHTSYMSKYYDAYDFNNPTIYSKHQTVDEYEYMEDEKDDVIVLDEDDHGNVSCGIGCNMRDGYCVSCFVTDEELKTFYHE